MFCPKCGTQITEGVFCPKCGNKIAENAKIDNQLTVQPAACEQGMAQPENTVQMNEKKNIPLNKKMIGMIGAAVAVILILVIAICTHKPTINLNKYVTVEYEGYDTLGRATAVVDWEAIEKKYGKKIKVNKKALKKDLKKELGSDYSDSFLGETIDEYLDMAGVDLLADCVSGSLDKSSGLTNGDEITYSFKFDVKEVEKYLKCKLKCSDKTFKVSGLKQVGSFNPFDGVTVSYSGIAPNGTASIEFERTDDYTYNLNYNLDKRDGLSNGDTVTVTVSVSGSEDTFVSNFGKLPSPLEQTYTVEGLMSYVKSAAEIPDDLMVSMQNQAEDIIKSYIANNWDSEVSLKSLVYMGNYYLTSKGSSWENNRCALVYKLTAEETMEAVDEGTVTEEVDVYYYVQFENLMVEDSGVGAVDISNYSVPNNYFTVETEHVKSDDWWTTYYSFRYDGFENLETLYNEVVTKNLENFAHEDNVVE